MEILLNNREKRLQKIVKMFFSSSSQLSISDISNKCSSTYPTVKSDLLFLEELIQKNHYLTQNCRLIKKDSTYEMIFSDSFNGKVFKYMFYHESLAYLFIKNLLMEEYKTTTDFFYGHNYSYTAVHKQYPKIKRALKPFNISFESHPSPNLNGAEKQIRLFAYYFFWNSNDGFNWPFKVSKDEIKEHFSATLDSFLRETNYSFNILDLEKQYVIFAVTLTRIHFGHLIDEIDTLDIKPYIKDSILFKYLYQPIKIFLKKYGLSDIELEREVIFLISMIRTQPISNASIDHQQNNIVIHRNNKSITYQLTISFLEKVEQLIRKNGFLTDINLSTPQIMNSLLAIHYQSIIFFSNCYSANNTDEKDKKIQLFLKRNMQYLIQDFHTFLSKEQLKKLVFNYEFLFYNYHVILSGFLPPELFFPPIYIKVISELGEVVSKRLALQIQLNLYYYNVQIIEAEESSNLDLLMTDSLTSDLVDFYKGKIFSLPEDLDAINWERLHNIFSSIEKEKLGYSGNVF